MKLLFFCSIRDRGEIARRVILMKLEIRIFFGIGGRPIPYRYQWMADRRTRAQVRCRNRRLSWSCCCCCWLDIGRPRRRRSSSRRLKKIAQKRSGLSKCVAMAASSRSLSRSLWRTQAYTHSDARTRTYLRAIFLDTHAHSESEWACSLFICLRFYLDMSLQFISCKAQKF